MTLNSNTPGGEPGNDDLGAMSSWYVWSAIGLYPTTPGTSTLAISAPIFPQVRLHLARGVVLINAPGATPGKYVQALSINNRVTQQTSLSGLDGMAQLQFTLSGTPNKSWGASGRDARQTVLRVPDNLNMYFRVDRQIAFDGSFTATITVNDARFAERENEQTDFRIASGSPVTIHSVQTTITGDGVLPMDLCS